MILKLLIGVGLTLFVLLRKTWLLMLPVEMAKTFLHRTSGTQRRTIGLSGRLSVELIRVMIVVESKRPAGLSLRVIAEHLLGRLSVALLGRLIMHFPGRWILHLVGRWRTHLPWRLTVRLLERWTVHLLWRVMDAKPFSPCPSVLPIRTVQSRWRARRLTLRLLERWTMQLRWRGRIPRFLLLLLGPVVPLTRTVLLQLLL